jgi:mycofactocin precursor
MDAVSTAQTTTTKSEKVSEPRSETETGAAETLVEEELLVEEVSIDGMCGVY